MKTHRVTSTEFRKNYGTYADMATGGTAIIITRHGRPSYVLIDIEEYRFLEKRKK